MIFQAVASLDVHILNRNVEVLMVYNTSKSHFFLIFIIKQYDKATDGLRSKNAHRTVN